MKTRLFLLLLTGGLFCACSKYIRTLTLWAVILLSAGSAMKIQAQERFRNRYSIGFGFAPEWQLGGDAGGKFSPSYGLFGEAQFSKHSGLELGIFDRRFSYTEKLHLAGGTRGEYELLKYHIQYVSLRLGYKFHSNILNFSTGFNIDLAVSNPQGAFVGKGFNKNNDRYGFYLSFSKEIALYKGLILEPEVHINPFLCDQNKSVKTVDYEGTFLGLGIRLKYRF